MALFTSRLNLYKPGGGLSGTNLPDEVADIDKINSNMDLVDAAVGIKRVTSTTRPPTPFNGQTIYETDTGLTQISNGTSWSLLVPGSANLPTNVPGPMGLVLIKPTSVVGTGGSLGANGKVTITAGSNVGIDGCFTSAFENYLVEVCGTTSAVAIIQTQLRAAGAYATGLYGYQGLSAAGATPIGTDGTGQLAWTLTNQGGSIEDIKAEFYQPALAVVTRMNSRFYCTSGSTHIVGTNGGNHNLATAYDGFGIISSAGTFTGTVRIYGYNNG